MTAPCDGCGAVAGQPCRPDCVGVAAHNDVCPTPYKRLFATEADAVCGYRTLRGVHVEPMRTYLCACGWWHLARVHKTKRM